MKSAHTETGKQAGREGHLRECSTSENVAQRHEGCCARAELCEERAPALGDLEVFVHCLHLSAGGQCGTTLSRTFSRRAVSASMLHAG